MTTVLPTETSPRTAADAAAARRLVADVADSVGELVADHIRLARVELAADVRGYAGAAGGAIGAILLVLVGCVLASIAAALGLARLTGMPAAFGVVAACHFVIGAFCVRAASAKMRRTRVLHETIAEARRSVRTLAHPSARGAHEH
jgi:hypothetical protein